MALELRDHAALQTDQVLVHRVARQPVLVALEALAEVVLLDEPAAHEEIQRAVDGRLADALSAAPEILLDVLHREVLVGGEDHLGDRLALVRHRQAEVPQVAAEQLGEGRQRCFRRHGSMASRK